VNRIALIGKSGVGKTEVAKHLADKHDFIRCSTGPLCREIAERLFGEATKTNMQLVSDVLIDLLPSVFLRAALARAGETSSLVIDALRYETDYNLARERGFTIVRVVASDERRRMFLEGRGESFNFLTDGVHQTEVELDAAIADYTIRNEGALDDLTQAADAVLGE
jgi:dephospho-CoA kinase